MDKAWRFSEKANTMALTTTRVMKKNQPILTVYHDPDDGMWQFLDGYECTNDEIILVSLKEVVDHDNSINEVASLPEGWVAWRSSLLTPWESRPMQIEG